MVERRTKRSSDLGEALTLLLESQRQSLGVRALTLTTRDGTLLAASYLDEHAKRESRARQGKTPVATWNLRMGTDELVIRSFGGVLNHDIGSGVRRIARVASTHRD